MPIPICPLLLQARATMAGGEMYADPTKAPGVACIGSRCAAWVPLFFEGRGAKNQHEGRCGMTHYHPEWHESQTFTDPAAQEVPRG